MYTESRTFDTTVLTQIESLIYLQQGHAFTGKVTRNYTHAWIWCESVTNEIQKVRTAIEQELISARICPEERFTELSPCGRYQLEVECYATVACPDYASLIVAVIRSITSGEIVATVKRNDERCFHAWVSREGHDYLILPEDLEGQTIIDLNSGRVEGYSSPDDGFIWAGLHPSPDRNKLAVEGCYWACPFQVTIYDFRDPMNLPLPTIAQLDLPANDAQFDEWVTNDSFSMVQKDGSRHVFAIASQALP